ncbi:zinc finger protein 260-like isoform X3 [Artemia franciscana]|uniref:zinc finger protein 260-like isoform X3 n=1 Tax=Artemia franciscana TaxID=6661 RepID=UPI0032DB302F
MEKLENDKSRIANLLHYLRKDEKFTDVNMFAEGTRFPCHRAFLSAVSPFFRRLFADIPPWEKELSLFLPDVAFTDLALILALIYQGEVYLEMGQGSNVFELVTMFELSIVKRETEVALVNDADATIHGTRRRTSLFESSDNIPNRKPIHIPEPGEQTAFTEKNEDICNNEDDELEWPENAINATEDSAIPRETLTKENLETRLRIWVCTLCRKMHSSQFLFELHTNTQCEKIIPLKCEMCQAPIGGNYHEFVIHLLEHRLAVDGKCPVCLSDCITDMKEHAIVMGHLSPCEDTNSLADVPSSSKQKKELRPRSKQIHYSEFPEFDMMSSDSEGVSTGHISAPMSLDLKNEATADLPDKPFRCDFCNKGFSRKGYLTSHITRVHKKKRKFACNLCDARFVTSPHLKRHIKTHTGEKSFKCSECQRAFAVKENLLSHMTIHTQEKRHVCIICDAKFLRNRHLNRHLALHRGEKSFICNVCQKPFAHRDSMIRHMRIHICEKRHVCNTCDARFLKRTALMRHMKRHTGEKSYKCDLCQRAFARKDTLSVHMKSHKKYELDFEDVLQK